MSRYLLRSSVFALAALLVATGCKDAAAPEGEAPVIPPQSTFVIPFDDFNDTPLAAGPIMPASPAAGTYWTRSAFVVGFWQLAVTVTLAVPVAAFAASFNHTPVWDGDKNAWTWPYDFTVLGIGHSARLEARLTAAGVQWDMYISRDGSFTDFHWYTGVSNLTGTEGTWSLNRDPQNPSAFIDIEWERALNGATWEIKYTVVEQGAANNGSYIEHGVTGGTPYDAFYDLFGAPGGNLTEIEWNRASKEGRTRDEDWFGDNLWKCWDSTLENATCP